MALVATPGTRYEHSLYTMGFTLIEGLYYSSQQNSYNTKSCWETMVGVMVSVIVLDVIL